MAQYLKKFVFNKKFNKNKYDWNKWLDGKIVKLTQGVDFQSKIWSFRYLVYMTARNMGKKIQSQIEGKSIIIQAFSKKQLKNLKGIRVLVKNQKVTK